MLKLPPFSKACRRMTDYVTPLITLIDTVTEGERQAVESLMGDFFGYHLEQGCALCADAATVATLKADLKKSLGG